MPPTPPEPDWSDIDTLAAETQARALGVIGAARAAIVPYKQRGWPIVGVRCAGFAEAADIPLDIKDGDDLAEFPDARCLFLLGGPDAWQHLEDIQYERAGKGDNYLVYWPKVEILT